ncbi:VWA domain-containing protein [Cupriavidus sp. AU9028]|uniref:VWA domain-containing protein n=1 Tax=Cupriavidus sp. AU9028 TaxID=2871157 RepID=UPI001C94179C|nr:VWA domain-containing protein [Cupriavidus sp. AU9028]MBY4899142.1 VWA domain-containing protein [Cupriavidus sp. AU9028]
MTEALERLPVFGFLWPAMLWLLALVVLLAFGYVWLDLRRRRVTASYPALKTVGPANRAGSGWRRHVPPVLMGLALTALIVAIARPQAMLKIPSRIETVILVLDLSGSMRAQDVQPSRIMAAKEAAKILVKSQPSGVSTGVVAMAGTAALAQAPVRSKEDVATAIDRLQVQGGTALGNGMLVALTALLPHTTVEAERLMNSDTGSTPERRSQPNPNAGPPPGLAVPDSGETATPGSYRAGAIVLFSDGESNAGPTALQAAQLAATHGVRVYTVGVGTPEGVVLSADGWSSRVKLDEQVLRQVADSTGAEYFRLEDAAELKKLYRALRARLAFGKPDQVEVTAFFAAAGALLATLAALLSLWWHGRVL